MPAAILASMIVMAAAAGLAALLGASAWRWRDKPGGGVFILLMASVGLYALFSALELATPAGGLKRLWGQLTYLGVVTVCPLWLMFTGAYSRRGGFFASRALAALAVEPVVMLWLVFTNAWHGWVWPSIAPASAERWAPLVYTHGPAVWAHMAYSYSLMIISVAVLLQVAWHGPRYFRRQVGLLITGALFPWLGNLVYLLGGSPLPGLDLTPLAFLLSGVAGAFALDRLGVLDMTPVAREALFNHLGAGVMVFDAQNRLVDCNPVARLWLNLPGNALGQDAFDDLKLPPKALLYDEDQPVQAEFSVAAEGETRYLDLSASSLKGAAGEVHGWVAVLVDVTAERQRTHQLELLNSITQLALTAADPHSLLQSLAKALGQLMKADGTLITFWEQETQRPVVGAAFGRLAQRLATLEASPGEATFTGAALQAGRALVEDDLPTSAHISPRLAGQIPFRSVVVLPLIADGQNFGAALVGFEQAHRFSPHEVTLGEQAAGQVALALAKSRLYESERRRVTQLTALQAVTQAVTSSLDLQQIFTTVVEVLQKTFGYTNVSVYRLHKDVLDLAAQIGYPEERVIHRIPVSTGVMGRAVRTRQTQFVPDISSDDDYLAASDNVLSEICVPLLKDQQVLGTLNIETAPPRGLTELDVMMMDTFAGQVAVAIDNASLFQAERNQRELAEALRETGIALSEQLDFDIVLDRMLDEIRRVVPYDTACVMEASPDSRFARITRVRGFDQFGEVVAETVAGRVYEISRTPNQKMMAETGQPLIIPDTALDPGWVHFPENKPVHAWMGAPISLHGQLLGFLSLEKVEPNFYQPEDAGRLAVFAGQAGIAIENARIYTELRRQAEKERLLFAAMRDFTAGLDTEAVLDAIVYHMTHALEVDGCAISAWDTENDCLSTLRDYDCTAGATPDFPGTTYFLKDYPATRQVLESRQAAMLSARNASLDPAEARLLQQCHKEELMIVPLMTGRVQQVFGVIELYREADKRSFSKADLEMAESFAAQAATAMENARLYSETQHLAVVDELTGLYNRRGLYELGEREVERASRFQHPLSALFLDIDHFKLFNDTFSYVVGDQVLCLLANCLRSNLREIDLIGRYGGEEFVALLPEADLYAAGQVAERLRAAVAGMRVKTERGESSITVSIGVCQVSAAQTTLEALLDRAGQTLHEAKARGRNRVALSV